MQKGQHLTRRGFLKTTAGAAAAVAFPYVVPGSALGKAGTVAPSNRVTMGFIGVGGMGTGDLKGFLNKPVVQVIAVCDVDRKPREDAQKLVNGKYSNSACAGYNDFREVIGRSDIDAVSLALPDHWHAIPAIMAARAGKDIHAQKPLAYTITEGRAIVEAVKKYGVVWQTGSQQRSERQFRFACELVRNGRIGKVHTVKVGLPNKNSIINNGMQLTQVPEGFDYEMWLGPAPWSPYCPSRCHWNFRWISDYSSGQITDWAGHHCDIAQWGMNTEHTSPIEIQGHGVFSQGKDGLFNTVEEYEFECKYAEGFTMMVSGQYPNGVRFEGTDGWVFVTRGRIEAYPTSLLDAVIRPGEIHLYKSDDHKQNFLNCVKTRGKTVAPVDVAHRSIMVGHLGVIAITLGRKVSWDPERERFINDDEANRMLSRPMRGTWHL
jgi:predicted dehydrogenase